MTRRFGLHELDEAAALLKAAGVLAYPTEAVFGLGCDPFDEAAVARVYSIKGRPPSLGFLLIAADVRQLDDVVRWSMVSDEIRDAVFHSWPGPTTWILPKCETLPALVTGAHSGVAVRVTSHPVAAELCRRFGGPLLSTSANLHGALPARTADDVLDQFPFGVLDGVIEAPTGGLSRPTTIIDALDGQVIRV